MKASPGPAEGEEQKEETEEEREEKERWEQRIGLIREREENGSMLLLPDQSLDHKKNEDLNLLRN